MKEYKSSYYNFIKDYGENKIAYNSKTGAVCLIEKDSTDKFMQIIENPEAADHTEEFFKNILEEGFIVEKDHDELQDLKELNHMVSSVSNVLRLTILPTETCNFTCPYCFIYTHRNKHMLEKTWKALFKLCQDFCEKNKDEKGFLLNLIWYGGAPLLVGKKIIEFMNKINNLLSQYPNGTLQSSILTNGYLLDFEMFQQLCRVNVRHIQVTVDGDAENHDKLRTLANNQPTFDKIYSNLLSIKENVLKDEKFTFAIRCNFLKSSVESSKRLIELFKKDFSQDKRFSLYFRPVYDFETDHESDEIEKSDFFGMTEGIQKQNELLLLTGQDIKHEYSVSNPLPEPIPSWCDSVNQNAYIIGYDGSIYICDTLITESEKAVGVLNDDGTITLKEEAKCWRKSIFERFDEVDGGSVQECIQCKLLPVCMGGCVRTRINNKGKACFWTEELIYKAMDEYAKLYGST